MKNREIANRIAELHYPNEPNAIHDQKYRLVRMKTLADQVESELNLLTIPRVSNWVAVKNDLPDNDNQVFVKYENDKYGINEWWESDNCWKYNFDNMIVKEWCKPPCC